MNITDLNAQTVPTGTKPTRDTIDQLCVNTVRTLAMDAVQSANSGHPGTPMALAPVAYCLWQRVPDAAQDASLDELERAGHPVIRIAIGRCVQPLRGVFPLGIRHYNGRLDPHHPPIGTILRFWPTSDERGARTRIARDPSSCPRCQTGRHVSPIRAALSALNGAGLQGGPKHRVFLQITCDDAADLPVPGRKYTFGVVKAAQARGDFNVLVEIAARCARISAQMWLLV